MDKSGLAVPPEVIWKLLNLLIIQVSVVVQNTGFELVLKLLRSSQLVVNWTDCRQPSVPHKEH